MPHPSTASRSAIPEEACIEQLMILRFGSSELVCPACGRRQRFSPVAKRRACVCEGCGHALYPALGTPFEKLRTSLSDWFRAVHLMRHSQPVAKELERRWKMPRAVGERVERELRTFDQRTKPGGAFEGWLDAISAFVDQRNGQRDAAFSTRSTRETAKSPPPAPDPAPPSKPARDPWRPWPLLAAGLFGGVILGLGLVVALYRIGEPAKQAREIDPATLSYTPPRPSLTLAAVEEDLAAAKAAVEEITKTPQAVTAPTPLPMPAPRPADSIIASTGDPNDVLTFGPIRVRRHLAETIVRASRVVGADPTLLMAIADKESSFATEVKAKTSSATGLFQFIDGTWLGVMAEFGRKHGLDKEAQAIVRFGRQWTVQDSTERTRILELRRDPYLSAVFAGEMLRRDTLRLEQKLGRHLTGGEIYLLHFLGPSDAQDFIDGVEDNPDADASALLPRPASANPSIFQGPGGRKTIAQVHRAFEEMMGKRLDRYREARNLGVGGRTAR
jgi:hypothetical protein